MDPNRCCCSGSNLHGNTRTLSMSNENIPQVYVRSVLLSSSAFPKENSEQTSGPAARTCLRLSAWLSSSFCASWAASTTSKRNRSRASKSSLHYDTRTKRRWQRWRVEESRRRDKRFNRSKRSVTQPCWQRPLPKATRWNWWRLFFCEIWFLIRGRIFSKERAM